MPLPLNFLMTTHNLMLYLRWQPYYFQYYNCIDYEQSNAPPSTYFWLRIWENWPIKNSSWQPKWFVYAFYCHEFATDTLQCQFVPLDKPVILKLYLYLLLKMHRQHTSPGQSSYVGEKQCKIYRFPMTYDKLQVTQVSCPKHTCLQWCHKLWATYYMLGFPSSIWIIGLSK